MARGPVLITALMLMSMVVGGFSATAASPYRVGWAFRYEIGSIFFIYFFV
jgi:hypothetical protein